MFPWNCYFHNQDKQVCPRNTSKQHTVDENKIRNQEPPHAGFLLRESSNIWHEANPKILMLNTLEVPIKISSLTIYS
jgi:hypothetical protein